MWAVQCRTLKGRISALLSILQIEAVQNNPCSLVLLVPPVGGGGPMKLLRLHNRTRLCYLLFASLILLDTIATIDVIAPVLGKFLIEPIKAAVATREEEVVVGEEAGETAEEKEEVVGEVVELVTTLLVEVLVLGILLITNITAMVGLQRTEAYLLVPWLFVYLIGFIRSFALHQGHQLGIIIQAHSNLDYWP